MYDIDLFRQHISSKPTLMFGHRRVITSDSLTNCDPVTSYGELNQHWLSLWLNSSRHHTNTRTNIDLPSHVFFGIHIRANPQEVFRFYVFMISTILLRGQWVNRDTIIYICLRVNNVLSIRVGMKYLSIPKLQRSHPWSLRMDKQFHSTSFWPCDYLSMRGLKLIMLVKQARGVW